MNFPPLIPSFSVLLERLNNISDSTLAPLYEMATKKKQKRNRAWLVGPYILYFPQKAKQQLGSRRKWAEDACPLWLVVFFCMSYWCSFCLCDCCSFLINWLMFVLAMFLWGLAKVTLFITEWVITWNAVMHSITCWYLSKQNYYNLPKNLSSSL